MLLPDSQDVLEGLAELENLARMIVTAMDPLPNIRRSVSILEMLGCVAVSHGGLTTTKSYPDILSRNLPGYFARGLSTLDANEHVATLETLNPSLSQLVRPSIFESRDLVLNVRDPTQLQSIGASLGLDEASLHELEECGRNFGLGSVGQDNKVSVEFEKVLDFLNRSSPNLSKIAECWGTLADSGLRKLLPVGVALAYAALRRIAPIPGLTPLHELLETLD